MLARQLQIQPEIVRFLLNYHQITHSLGRFIDIGNDVLCLQSIERVLEFGRKTIRNFPWWLDHSLCMWVELRVISFVIPYNSSERILYSFVMRSLVRDGVCIGWHMETLTTSQVIACLVTQHSL